MRIGVAYSSSDGLEEAWSGIPWGLTTGLREISHEPTQINLRIPRTAERAFNLWSRVGRAPHIQVVHSRPAFWVNEMFAKRTVRHSASVDAVVLLGSEHGAPFSVPIATFEDMTVVQAFRMGHPAYVGLDQSTAQRWVETQRRLYDAAVACCVASAWTAASVVEDYSVPPEKVRVVGFGRNRDPVEADRRWDQPRFLFVGKAWHRKNGPLVVDSFREIRRQCPEAMLDVVGNVEPVSGDGVTGHGSLSLSNRDDRATLDRLFGAATCFVMPSAYEPFGIVYVEAGASGVGSIGTTVGGAVDAIGPGGMVIDPGDKAQLVEGMRSFLDPDFAKAMGDAARRHAENFTWSKVARRIASSFQMSSS